MRCARRGHVVGFIGDGINDAPALRAADIGISVDSAVDIANEAADIILLDKSLLVLDCGVIEGRSTFCNMLKYIRMMASSNFGNVLSVLVASALLPFLPMLPLQLLVKNLTYDISQTAMPFDNVDAELVAKPLQWNPTDIGRFILFFGPVSTVFDLGTFAVLWRVFQAQTVAQQGLFQSGWFAVGLLTQTLVVHMPRTPRLPFIDSRAAWPLMVVAAAIVVLGLWLPQGPLAGDFKLQALTAAYFLWLAAILIGDALLATAMKRFYIRRFGWQVSTTPQTTRTRMNATHPLRRADLVRIATEAMVERGLEPVFPPSVHDQLAAIAGPGRSDDPHIRDLTSLPWCSLDNDDSLDLDQLTAARALPDGRVKLFVAIADVDALVTKGSAIDGHAWTNTTSVYTSAKVFPMLPERLCTDLTSLNPGQERLALVTEMDVAADATILQSTVHRARVRSQAKLAYDAVSAWIDGSGALPEPARAVPGMDTQLRLQDEVAQRLRARRHAQGALEFQTFQPRAAFDGERVVDIRLQEQNRGRQLIEELMIATNACTARFLAAAGGASLRRVVRSPERWARIVTVASRYGEVLPDTPDPRALERFLARRHQADPLRFPDLSLVIVKLMGSGVYVVEAPQDEPIGHFGLALRDYTHSTAPNRRYPDLVTQRMVKAVLGGSAPPYSMAELQALALHCTQQEDAAQKVERRMRKTDAALLLSTHLGQRYDAIVTGRTSSATFVRVFAPPVEGMLVGRHADVDVGETLRVKLVATDVAHGFIDFERDD